MSEGVHFQIDFEAKIEEEKKKAKVKYEQMKSEAKQAKEELITPLTTDMQSFKPFSGIPGLGSATPKTGTAGDDQPWGKGSEGELEEDNTSPIDATVLTKPRQVSTTGAYAGLISARKRKHDESTSTTESPSSRRKSVASESSRSGNIDSRARRPYAPQKKSPRGARPTFDEVRKIDTRTTSKPSSWYESIDMKQKFSRSDLNAVQYINTLIKDCQKEAARSGNLEPLFAKIRQRLHQMEFYGFLSGVIMKKSKVLEDDVGLPQIHLYPQGVEYPWDVKDDAEMLYTKWMRGQLDPHLLRGIESLRKQRASGKSSISHKLKTDYASRVSCNEAGDNNLQNGQWWPLQICAMRDGAHGEIEAGIHGQPKKGAFSVVLSGGGYADVDEGDRILYCGTSGFEGKPTAGTNYLKETFRLLGPLRVLRSSALPQSNIYRPSKGLRYDGLYDIVGYEVIDHDTAMHRFELRRRPDQHPIRYKGVEVRPTNEELLEYSKIRHLLGIGTA